MASEVEGAMIAAAPHGQAISAKQPAAAHLAAWTSFEPPVRRAAWDELARVASTPNPFFASWFLLPALRAHDRAHRVKLLCLEADGQLVGLMPVLACRHYYGRRIPHLASWTHPNCFLGAPLVAKGYEGLFWHALLQWADQAAGTALFLHLPTLPLDDGLYPALVQVLAGQGRRAGIVHREERAMLRAEVASEDYLVAALSGKKRKELRRQFARLSELGNVQIARMTGTAQLDIWVEQFLSLEHAGWKGSAGSALASHHATADMFRAIMAGAARHGELERLSLTLEGQPLAMLASFVTPPAAFSFKTAFDERYARYSPGVLLQRENLAVLDNPAIAWADSCASADHPMIDHIWRERRPIGHLSIAIGGGLRRALFRQLLGAELRRNPHGVSL